MSKFIQHLIVPTNAELQDEANYLSNWQSYRIRFIDCPHCKLSRRPQAEFMSVVMAYLDHNRIFLSDGTRYRLPEFDSVFPDFPDYRTFSEYTACNEGGNSYLRKTRCPERLRFFWIFMNVFDDCHRHISLCFIHSLLSDNPNHKPDCSL